MKILVCAIVKNENHYLHEWVEWYRSIGFDKIVIYDNNDLDGETIQEDVEVVNYRGRTCCQLEAYNDCYLKYNNEYDWIAFLDADEFLETDKPVKEWLHGYSGYDGVKVCWQTMTDSGLVRVNNGDYGRQRFIESTPITHRFNYQCKTIVRGRTNAIWMSAHHPEFVRICDVKGRPETNSNRCHVVLWVIARIKHYRYRTIEEYIEKQKRAYPDMPREKAARKLTNNAFFSINARTEEKEKYIRENGCGLYCGNR